MYGFSLNDTGCMLMSPSLPSISLSLSLYLSLSPSLIPSSLNPPTLHLSLSLSLPLSSCSQSLILEILLFPPPLSRGELLRFVGGVCPSLVALRTGPVSAAVDARILMDRSLSWLRRQLGVWPCQLPWQPLSQQRVLPLMKNQLVHLKKVCITAYMDRCM